MKKVLILGASGSIASIVSENLILNPDIKLTLLVRRPERLEKSLKENSQVTIIVADVLKNPELLYQSMLGQDLVYANLYGDDLERQAEMIVKTMNKTNLKRIIWISANGIYNEIPGEYGQWNEKKLGDTLIRYAKSAKVIEESNLDYTIVRPAWFSNKNIINYELTNKGEAFKGTEVSRKSVAAYITALIEDGSEAIKKSIGISEPNSQGPRPSFF